MKTVTINNHQYTTVENESDLEGWRILYIEDFKPGVKRLHLLSNESAPAEFQMVYCSNKIFVNIDPHIFLEGGFSE